jgi:hypothetical protein
MTGPEATRVEHPSWCDRDLCTGWDGVVLHRQAPTRLVGAAGEFVCGVALVRQEGLEGAEDTTYVEVAINEREVSVDKGAAWLTLGQAGWLSARLGEHLKQATGGAS